tara:strand:- start:95 stop:349 length:255 start_codon:yes stop_codon:yes gene_type:complete
LKKTARCACTTRQSFNKNGKDLGKAVDLLLENNRPVRLGSDTGVRLGISTATSQIVGMNADGFPTGKPTPAGAFDLWLRRHLAQ